MPERLSIPSFEMRWNVCGLSDNIASMFRLRKLLNQHKTQLAAVITRIALRDRRGI